MRRACAAFSRAVRAFSRSSTASRCLAYLPGMGPSINGIGMSRNSSDDEIRQYGGLSRQCGFRSRRPTSRLCCHSKPTPRHHPQRPFDLDRDRNPRPTSSALRSDSALHQVGDRQTRAVSLHQRRQVHLGAVKALFIEAAKGVSASPLQGCRHPAQSRGIVDPIAWLQK